MKKKGQGMKGVPRKESYTRRELTRVQRVSLLPRLFRQGVMSITKATDMAAWPPGPPALAVPETAPQHLAAGEYSNGLPKQRRKLLVSSRNGAAKSGAPLPRPLLY
jgi:hypothetical protein